MKTQDTWQDAQTAILAIGDRVEGGDGENHDTGTVDDIQGQTATVRWDSGAVTPSPLSILRMISQAYYPCCRCEGTGTIEDDEHGDVQCSACEGTGETQDD